LGNGSSRRSNFDFAEEEPGKALVRAKSIKNKGKTGGAICPLWRFSEDEKLASDEGRMKGRE
jgi:hypothetical protein